MQDPGSALRHVLDLPPGETRRNILHLTARHQSDRNAEAVLEWANQLTDEHERQIGISYALRSKAARGDGDLLALIHEYGWDLVRTNPMDRIGGSGIVGGDLSEDASEAIIKLAATNSEEAIRYLEKFDGFERTRLVERLERRHPALIADWRSSLNHGRR